MYSKNSVGRPSHREANEFYRSHDPFITTSILDSMILLYFCFFVCAFRPCHGSFPTRKYMNM